MRNFQTVARERATSNVSETVPGWRSLMSRIDAKDERIEELEREIEELEAKVDELRAAREPDSESDGETRAKALVDALRRTLESPQ